MKGDVSVASSSYPEANRSLLKDFNASSIQQNQEITYQNSAQVQLVSFNSNQNESLLDAHHQSQNSSHLNGMADGEAPKHMAKTYDKRAVNGHHISSQLIVNNEILNKEIQTQ